MSLSSFAECRTYQFSYENREALYLDHHGQRVLADVEGSGDFSISASPEKTTIWVDGTIANPNVSHFSESLIVTSESSGVSTVSVLRGFRPTVVGQTVTTEKFEGCGWILGSERIDSVDDMTDGFPDMPQVLPVPVMLGAQGKGLRVAKLEGAFRKLFELDLSSPGSVKEHRWDAKNASKLFDLSSVLPGQGVVSRQVLSHLNQGSFEIDKPAGCRAILVRKLFDAFHGRQRARLLVNGKFNQWWYEPVEDRTRRWRWGQIGFSTTEAAEKLAVGMDPPAGAPLWSVSLIQVFALS